MVLYKKHRAFWKQQSREKSVNKFAAEVQWLKWDKVLEEWLLLQKQERLVYYRPFTDSVWRKSKIVKQYQTKSSKVSKVGQRSQRVGHDWEGSAFFQMHSEEAFQLSTGAIN